VKRKYSQGGQILAGLASLIPGGQLLSPLISMGDEMFGPKKQEQVQAPIQQITNPFGYALGGLIQDGFKQYNTGSHKSGKDLVVNSNGIPDQNGTNAVQNKENTFKIKGQPYVMSDTLVNPNTGNTYNMDARKTNNKFKGSRFYTDEKNSLDRTMSELSKLNDISRTVAEFACGGSMKKKMYGGPTDPPSQESTMVKPRPVAGMMTSPIDPLISLNRGAANKFVNNFNPTYEKPISATLSKNFRYGEHAAGGILDNGDPLVPPSDNINWLSQSMEGDRLLYNNPLKQLNISSQPKVPSLVKQAARPLDRLVPNTTEQNPAQPYNGIALGLKTLALGRSVFDALQPAEKENLIKPNYTAADNYIKEATIDYSQAKQDAVGTSNVLASMNRSGSSGYNQMLGREAARLGTLGDQIGRISEGQANANSQLNMTKGQYEANKAVDIANRQQQNRANNQMNQANQRGFQRDLFSNLSQIGTELNRYGEVQKVMQNQRDINQFNTNQTLALLNTKYPNLKVDPNIVQKFQNGEISIDDFLTYVPANVRQDVKQNTK